ncbi:hypothetical protein EXIGLDRAFT_766731 [Exidia glandulosa HHB12029]|uniref:Uncharacterized protein n=1 Tax=Exidia glandulosa HHB12029 TaxID=1314781 RepID=A0A165JHL2_EXIGL|nr:hypothetical protein EXIGLDRAFT_766731 [Exidia glandulosa HHB12029]
MGDLVVPVPFFSQITTALDIMYFMDVVVSGQLQPDVLKGALEELTELGGWRKLGARLKRSKQHGFEFHIPKRFSAERPAFLWDERREDKSASDAGILPSRTASVSLHPALADGIGRYRPPRFARRVVKELLTDPKRLDDPILQASVVVFRDVTLISLSVPHILTDAMGFKNIFSAWCTVLAGRKETVPPLLDFDVDPLRDVQGEYGSDIARGTRVRVASKLALVRFYAKYAIEVVKLPDEETRIIFIPLAKLEAVKAAAKSELASRGVDGWVSTADAVSAVMMKLGTLFYKPTDTRPFALAFSANARGRVPALQSAVEKDGFIGCAVLSHNTAPTPVSDIRGASLASLAIMHRTAVQQLDSPSEVAANISTSRRAYEKQRWVLNFKIRGTGYYVTNWMAADYTSLDFTAALAPNIERTDAAGRVLFAAGDAAEVGMMRRNWSIVFAKDGPAIPEQERGVWLETGFARQHWPAVEEFLASV